jgi:hypothetical protein
MPHTNKDFPSEKNAPTLPVELWAQILGNLRLSNLKNLGQTARFFRALIMDKPLMKSYFKERLLRDPEEVNTYGKLHHHLPGPQGEALVECAKPYTSIIKDPHLLLKIVQDPTTSRSELTESMLPEGFRRPTPHAITQRAMNHPNANPQWREFVSGYTPQRMREFLHHQPADLFIYSMIGHYGEADVLNTLCDRAISVQPLLHITGNKNITHGIAKKVAGHANATTDVYIRLIGNTLLTPETKVEILQKPNANRHWQMVVIPHLTRTEIAVDTLKDVATSQDADDLALGFVVFGLKKYAKEAPAILDDVLTHSNVGGLALGAVAVSSEATPDMKHKIAIHHKTDGKTHEILAKDRKVLPKTLEEIAESPFASAVALANIIDNPRASLRALQEIARDSQIDESVRASATQREKAIMEYGIRAAAHGFRETHYPKAFSTTVKGDEYTSLGAQANAALHSRLAAFVRDPETRAAQNIRVTAKASFDRKGQRAFTLTNDALKRKLDLRVEGDLVTTFEKCTASGGSLWHFTRDAESGKWQANEVLERGARRGREDAKPLVLAGHGR